MHAEERAGKVRFVNNAPPPLAPLSDADLAELGDLLVDRSPFDVDGLLGLLHAVAIAPGLVRPPTWLSLVLPEGIESSDAGAAERLTGLILRLYNQVIGTLEGRNTIIPEADDASRCKAFADGFIAGAAADPEWLENDEHWTFASWAAYLSGKHDLVAPALLEEMDDDPDTKSTLRKQIGSIIVTTYETFLALRRRTLTAAKPATSAPRVGRNDPCPCGSGKKYKRCCIGGAPGATT